MYHSMQFMSIFKLIITSIAKGKSLRTSIAVNNGNDEETRNCLLDCLLPLQYGNKITDEVNS